MSALFEEIAGQYMHATKITRVIDNLNTHEPGALCEAFSPENAKALWDRFDFIHTPKHGSWLNMADIELNVPMGQCLDQKIENIEVVRGESGMAKVLKQQAH